MDGFRVDTAKILEASAQYHTVNRSLVDDADRLHRAIGTLQNQTIGSEIPQLLRAAVQQLNAAVREARELGLQCAEIADTYERTETQVASVVAALPAVSPFAVSAVKTAAAQAVAHTAVRVNSPLRPARPILLSGNRLPCESWLLARAIKASTEGEQLWK